MTAREQRQQRRRVRAIRRRVAGMLALLTVLAALVLYAASYTWTEPEDKLDTPEIDPLPLTTVTTVEAAPPVTLAPVAESEAVSRYAGIEISDEDVYSEGHTRGIASNHGDVMHWFPRHGKNMDDFRAEVARLIKNQSGKDELDMTKEELVSCAGTGDNPSGWAREHTEYCKQKGIFAGDGAGNYGWQQPITREAVATIVHRALEVAGLADSIPDA